MRRICYLICYSCSFLTALAQNTGVNTTNPVQTLDVNGAVRIGNSSNNQAGSIRYNSGRFEEGDGATWRYLGLPSKSIILVQSIDTASLKSAGFSVLRQMENWDTVLIPVTTNYAGTWNTGFPLSSTEITPASPASTDCVIYNNRFIYYGSDAFLYDYDITAQKWSRLPNSSPLGVRNAPGVVLVGNDIYVMGGWRFEVGPGFVIYNSAAKYNLLTNTWTSITNIPVSNCYQLTVAIGTDIYLLNGASSFTSTFVYNKKMYRYNTVTNSWSADLSVAATPSFINQGQAAVSTNKIVYHTNGLRVYSYDPVSHVITTISAGTPTSVLQQGLHTITSGKLSIIGTIADTTNITSVPNTYQLEHFEVDLATGNTVKLSVCNLIPDNIVCYRYHAGTNKIYSVGYSNSSNIYDRAGSQQCDVILRRRGYWYYMKKN